MRTIPKPHTVCTVFSVQRSAGKSKGTKQELTSPYRASKHLSRVGRVLQCPCLLVALAWAAVNAYQTQLTNMYHLFTIKPHPRQIHQHALQCLCPLVLTHTSAQRVRDNVLAPKTRTALPALPCLTSDQLHQCSSPIVAGPCTASAAFEARCCAALTLRALSSVKCDSCSCVTLPAFVHDGCCW